MLMDTRAVHASNYNLWRRVLWFAIKYSILGNGSSVR